jgi:hypothetical protein
MKKRGLSYVDWSISIGLFIIYIITIFILLGPAFKQDYSEDYLSSIVKDGLAENTTLEINRFPVFIRSMAPIDSNPHTFTLKDLPKEFEGIDDENFLILDNSGNAIINKNYEPSGKRIRFDSSFSDMGILSDTDIGKLYIFLSEDTIFEDTAPVEQAWTDTNNTFGVPETISGIYQEYFKLFTTNDYIITKEILKYPADKDFIIEIYNETRFDEPTLFNYTKEQPEEKDEVNVLLWADWLIHNNTQRTPITVLVKTW